MGLSDKQAVVVASGRNMAAASSVLLRELEGFQDARVVALVQQTNWMTSFSGKVTLLAVVDHD
jgi:hypothetical protein